jgi:hypothetical protein
MGARIIVDIESPPVGGHPEEFRGQYIECLQRNYRGTGNFQSITERILQPQRPDPKRKAG